MTTRDERTLNRAMPVVRVDSRVADVAVWKEALQGLRDRQKIAISVGYHAVGPVWAPKEMIRAWEAGDRGELR